MRKGIITLIAVLLSSCAVFAQNQGGDPKSSEQLAQEFVMNLNQKIILTRLQRDSITNVFRTFYDDMSRYQGDYHDKMKKALKTNRDVMVKRILNDETKYQTYLKLVEERQRNRYENGTHAGGH
jgi:hypothetical protein